MTRQIGFMQGRLCERVDGKIQAFPWRDWENEFPAAAAIDLHLMEWTLRKKNIKAISSFKPHALVKAITRKY